MNQYLRGFTLIELLITLTIVTLMITQAAPAYSYLIERSHRHTETSNLISLLNLARNTAVSEGRAVTVCALDNNDKCTRDWTFPIVAFRDQERHRQLSDDSQIIRVFEPGLRGYFTANSGIRDYFRFRPSGMAREAIGNIIWCPDSHAPEMAAQVRINMGGRMQTATDNDADGIVEGADGKPVSCSSQPT